MQYRINWEEPEYTRKGKEAWLEEKWLQGVPVIIFRKIATQAQNFVSFGSSISPKGRQRLPQLFYPCWRILVLPNECDIIIVSSNRNIMHEKLLRSTCI